MAVPERVLQLIERFEQNAAAYRSGNYNETQLRREFLDPFFAALGWDMDNERGLPEAYKDVIHEDAIKFPSRSYPLRASPPSRVLVTKKVEKFTKPTTTPTIARTVSAVFIAYLEVRR